MHHNRIYSIGRSYLERAIPPSLPSSPAAGRKSYSYVIGCCCRCSCVWHHAFTRSAPVRSVRSTPAPLVILLYLHSLMCSEHHVTDAGRVDTARRRRIVRELLRSDVDTTDVIVAGRSCLCVSATTLDMAPGRRRDRASRLVSLTSSLELRPTWSVFHHSTNVWRLSPLGRHFRSFFYLQSTTTTLLGSFVWLRWFSARCRPVAHNEINSSIVISFVCLFESLRYCGKTARHIVETLSLLGRRIVFSEMNFVTKFWLRGQP